MTEQNYSEGQDLFPFFSDNQLEKYEKPDLYSFDKFILNSQISNVIWDCLVNDADKKALQSKGYNVQISPKTDKIKIIKEIDDGNTQLEITFRHLNKISKLNNGGNINCLKVLFYVLSKFHKEDVKLNKKLEVFTTYKELEDLGIYKAGNAKELTERENGLKDKLSTLIIETTVWKRANKNTKWGIVSCKGGIITSLLGNWKAETDGFKNIIHIDKDTIQIYEPLFRQKAPFPHILYKLPKLAFILGVFVLSYIRKNPDTFLKMDEENRQIEKKNASIEKNAESQEDAEAKKLSYKYSNFDFTTIQGALGLRQEDIKNPQTQIIKPIKEAIDEFNKAHIGITLLYDDKKEGDGYRFLEDIKKDVKIKMRVETHEILQKCLEIKNRGTHAKRISYLRKKNKQGQKAVILNA